MLVMMRSNGDESDENDDVSNGDDCENEVKMMVVMVRMR